ncbi:MAG: hypothetical protein KAR83_05210 [Thermodesulfovibrionales bacterium]|nr:hypothetical protein [Thermodesulfovibrionales bacterium]
MVLLSAGQAQAATLSKGPVEVDCISIMGKGRLMVALVFGQSNSANFGLTPKRSAHGVYSFYNGKCFQAADPLPGAEGHGGSIWTRLGDIVIASGLYDRVLFVPVGAGTTKVSDWRPGGRVHYKLASGLRGPMATGFEFTHLIWMQGEHDAIEGTSRAAYKEDFEVMLSALRSGGVDTPVFVSLTTLCGRYESDDIRRAQRQIAEDNPGVFSGPDTDALGKKYRYDACHFNDEGLEAAASAWFAAIKTIE